MKEKNEVQKRSQTNSKSGYYVFYQILLCVVGNDPSEKRKSVEQEVYKAISIRFVVFGTVVDTAL